MVKFIPVRYSIKNYPSNIVPKIQETTANFFNFFKHQKAIQATTLPYLSLHTDPGYRGKRYLFLSSELPNEFPVISANVTEFGSRCVAKLWSNDKKWGEEFADFLVKLTDGIDHSRIKVIEVHPPFDTSCGSLENFLEIYAVFEKRVIKEFPSVTINIENRCNPDPKRKGGTFLLSNSKEIIKIAQLLAKTDSKLQLVIDIPQLLSEHYGNVLLSEEMIKEALTPIREIRDRISGVHIWGYNISKGTGGQHGADFNTYFNNDEKLKICFLQVIRKLFDDGKPRYFVPEVGSTAAVHSIVNDLIRYAGVEFVESE